MAWVRPSPPPPPAVPRNDCQSRHLSSSPSWEKFVHEEFVKLMHDEETLEDVEPLEESNAFWQYQVSKLMAQ